MSDQLYINFDEYIRQGEPAQREKAGYWQTAIGLQAVDGLKTSDYLQNTARRHIEGEITIDEARDLVNQYYITKTAHEANDEDTEEWRVQPNLTTLQIPDKSPDKLPDKLNTKNQYVKNLVMVVGTNELSVKEMLSGLGLKDRESFMDVYLSPAIKGKYVRLLFPKSPRHPRQKYLLTVKGLALYYEIKKKKEGEA